MTEVRVLLVEDVADDAALVERALRRGGIDVRAERVESVEAMSAALRNPPDVVICDCHLPGFGPEAALSLLRNRQLDVPFILVSGYIGEEAADALMRAGVHDFVPKDNLHRLVPAVLRELQEA